MSLFVNEAPILGDSTVVRSISLGQDVKVQLEEFITITNLSATTGVSQTILIVPKGEQIQITGFESSFGTASSSGTVTLEKLTGTTAAGSGTALLTGTVALSGTANTPAFGTLISTVSSLNLSSTTAVQDRLGLVFAGTMTSLVNGFVQVRFRRIQ